MTESRLSNWTPDRTGPIASAFFVVVLAGSALSVPQKDLNAQAISGEEVFTTVCAVCHGLDGLGGPGVELFSMELPDFTDCSFNSREPDSDFFAVAYAGGPIRGFSQNMPAHGATLGEERIQAALDYIRTFCTDDDWPRGELNLPKPLVTEKAYPEDEGVSTLTIDEGTVVNEFLYEKRFGARNQLEVKLPFGFRETASVDGGDWNAGIGDVTLGVKRAVFHSLASGSILSIGGEVVLPTGDEDEGFGKGTVVLEPFMSYGQILPGETFLHFQGLGEFPTDGDKAAEEAQLRSVFGWSVNENQFGRTWTPMLEVIGKAEFEDDETETDLDLIPQLQVTLNTRQHIMLNMGVRIPVTHSDVRPTQFMMYLLWDWFDGGFFDGW